MRAFIWLTILLLTAVAAQVKAGEQYLVLSNSPANLAWFRSAIKSMFDVQQFLNFW